MAPQALLDAPERPAAEAVPRQIDEALRYDDRRLVIIILVASAVALVLGGGAAAALGRSHAHRHAAPASVASAPLLTVDPPNGATGVRPDAKITVLANEGRFASITVTDGAGHQPAGTMGPLAHSWQSTGILPFDARFTVTAHVLGVKKSGAVVQTSSFSTIRPAGLLKPTITPGDGQTVGVGAPIVFRFKAPVANKAAVLQAINVTMSNPVPGAWRWFGPRELHYRPQNYWPTGEKVAVNARLANLDVGGNMWGEADHSVAFTVGDAHVSTVDTDGHVMTVTVNGTPVRTVPMSAGRDKYPTMGGIHIVLGKSQHVVMDSETVGIPRNSPDGYREDVYWNVAITNGGEYVHAAPWSTGAQGNRNVSHGCVNLSTSDATWFYNFSLPGDVIQVVGSPRPPSDDAGVVDWKIPWDQWAQPT
jgi:lipoprotein-anchoring transpeptidase ErfK/SrfK